MSDFSEKPAAWQRLASAVHAKCRVYDILKNRFRHPRSGREADFFVIDSAPWANVCAVTPQNELVMIRQFRFGVEDYCWEFPGGVLHPEEDPITGGLRELREETGYTGTNPRVLGTVWPNPAIQNNACTLIRVDDAEPAHATDWDENEEIEIRLVPYEELREWGREGKLRHSLALNQLYYLEKSFQDAL